MSNLPRSPCPAWRHQMRASRADNRTDHELCVLPHIANGEPSEVTRHRSPQPNSTGSRIELKLAGRERSRLCVLPGAKYRPCVILALGQLLNDAAQVNDPCVEA